MEPFIVAAQTDVPGLVVLVGELDLATKSALDTVLDRQTGDVLVDCTALSFVDTAGFHWLERGYNAAVNRDATFGVAGFNHFQQRRAGILNAPHLFRPPRSAGSGSTRVRRWLGQQTEGKPYAKA